MSSSLFAYLGNYENYGVPPKLADLSSKDFPRLKLSKLLFFAKFIYVYLLPNWGKNLSGNNLVKKDQTIPVAPNPQQISHCYQVRPYLYT